MTATPVRAAFAGLVLCAWVGPGPAAPAPKEKPALTLKLVVTGKLVVTVGDHRHELAVADAGEVVVTNTSAGPIDIGSVGGPLGLLDLKVKGPTGAGVETEPLATLISPSLAPPSPFLLDPGESYRRPITLLVMIPEGQRKPGVYKVKAVYTHARKEYESAEVEVKWPGDGK